MESHIYVSRERETASRTTTLRLNFGNKLILTFFNVLLLIRTYILVNIHYFRDLQTRVTGRDIRDFKNSSCVNV